MAGGRDFPRPIILPREIDGEKRQERASGWFDGWLEEISHTCYT
jgi:hypothetical protein